MWDPDVYLQQADFRARPFLDLMARVAATDPVAVVDLGCGPGSLTRRLADRWPAARVVGVDASADMVRRASADDPHRKCEYTVGDIRAWMPDRPVDVLVTNATLQWVPDHLPLLRAWVDALAVGGWLALAVPANFDAPSHTLLRGLADSPRWCDQLVGVLRHTDAVASPRAYLDLFATTGCEVDVWQTTYLHMLRGVDAVLGWMRGTGLRPVLAALSSEDGSAFAAEYAELLRTAYPAESYGTPFPFTRTFAVAHRAPAPPHQPGG